MGAAELSDESVLVYPARIPLPPSQSTLSLPLDSEQASPPELSQGSLTPSTEFSQFQLLESHGGNTFSLPPVDGGFGAWSFLAAAFFVESIVWGIPDAFGVFLEVYLKDETYNTQRGASSMIPLIGPLASGIMYGSAPFIYTVTARYPAHRRTALWTGAFICVGSLIGAGFTTKVANLLVLQGVVYALGGSLLYAPCISFMSEWFIARRGLANGIIFAGTAVGGLILPLVLPRLISAYGASKTLLILGISSIVILLPLIPFLKGRLPNIRQTRGPNPRSRSPLLSPTFVILIAVNTIQSFGYHVPLMWLPTFAGELKISSNNTSLALALLNGASFFSRLFLGYLSDKTNPWILAFSSLAVTSFIIFVFWGVLSFSAAGLLSYGVVFGLFAGGWACLWTGLIRDIVKDDPVLATSLFGYLMLSRGVGNIFSTPISSALQRGVHESMRNVRYGFDVGGGRFRQMIIYAGGCFAAASVVAFFGWFVGLRGGRRVMPQYFTRFGEPTSRT